MVLARPPPGRPRKGAVLGAGMGLRLNSAALEVDREYPDGAYVGGTPPRNPSVPTAPLCFSGQSVQHQEMHSMAPDIKLEQGPEAAFRKF